MKDTIFEDELLLLLPSLFLIDDDMDIKEEALNEEDIMSFDLFECSNISIAPF